MRYTRQELKQDRFAETAAEAAHWTVAHRSTIITSGMAAVILLVIVVGGYWYTDYRGAAASKQLGDALLIYNAPLRPAGMPADPRVLSFSGVAERAQAAKKELYRISSQYGSTRAGQWAHYLAALAEVDLGNYALAEGQLKDVANSRDAGIASLAKLALASVERDEGKESEAVAVYQDLIAHPTMTVPKVTAEFSLAEVYEAKQPAEARKLYQQITKDDPKGPASQLAAQREKALPK